MSSPDGWSFLGPRVALVSSFPPAICGIGRYADQLASALRQDHAVATLALDERGHGDQVLDLVGRLKPLRLLRATRPEQDIVIMWHPHFFVGGGPLSRTLLHLAFGVVFRCRRVTVLVHEPYDPPRRSGLGAKIVRGVQELAKRYCWTAPVRLAFHTEFERDRFVARFPAGRQRQACLVPHGAFFKPRTELTREAAREALGLPADEHISLCIGFLGPYKGYDRAVRAFRSVAPDDARLYVVGSALRPTPDVAEYIEELRELADATPGTHLVEKFVDDAEFDAWIVASDLVITPYRSSASSGVVERVRMLDRPLLSSTAGGLAEQAAGSTFRTDEELQSELARRLGTPAML
jgi:glycosyltransferase involved in cell wall biosynthesis